MITRLLKLGGALILVTSLGVLVPTTAFAAPASRSRCPSAGSAPTTRRRRSPAPAATAAGDAATITLDVYAGSDTSVSPVRTFDVSVERSQLVAGGGGVGRRESAPQRGRVHAGRVADVGHRTRSGVERVRDRCHCADRGRHGAGQPDHRPHADAYGHRRRGPRRRVRPGRCLLGSDARAERDHERQSVVGATRADRRRRLHRHRYSVGRRRQWQRRARRSRSRSPPARRGSRSSHNPGNNHDVYSQYLDGTGRVNLTNNVALEESPSFSRRRHEDGVHEYPRGPARDLRPRHGDGHRHAV